MIGLFGTYTERVTERKGSIFVYTGFREVCVESLLREYTSLFLVSAIIVQLFKLCGHCWVIFRQTLNCNILDLIISKA